MENREVNHGFIEPKITPEHYLFGSGQVSLQTPSQPNGDWTPFLPPSEDQNLRDIETYNCTAFATTNQIETYMKRKFGLEANYSDRFLGIMAGTRPPGNDPQNVYEAVRKYGLVPEEMCPFSNDIQSVDEYFSWKGVDREACLKAGQDWLSKYVFNHDWVASGTDVSIPILRTALQYSPLCCGVWAWTFDGTKYVRMGGDCHWSMQFKIDDYVEDFDSYDPNNKNLDLNFGFRFAKRIRIELNTLPEQLTIIQRILSLIYQILPFLK